MELTKGKVKSLENVTEHQISQIQAAENEVRVTLCMCMCVSCFSKGGEHEVEVG